MRRAIRVSVYVAPGMGLPGNPPPMTVATFEENLIVTPEALAEQMRVPGVLVTSEIFETDAPNEAVAAIEAVERIDAEESNMAIMYFWTLAQMERVSSKGAILMPGPNPLTVAQATDVLEQIAMHPSYSHQRISTPDVTGDTWVILNDGKIETEAR